MEKKDTQEEIKFKQFVIVPKRLRMSSGKIASQVAHATFMALYKQSVKNLQLIRKWKNSGMCTIILQCKDVTKLLGAESYCREWKIPYHLYVDEGFTEVEPMTPTCLATGVLLQEQSVFFSKFELYTDSITNLIIRKLLNLVGKKT